MYKINELPTPCFVIDEGKLEENLKLLHQVEERTGAKILLAQKCFSCFSEYPLIGKYISGTTASGLYEARLGKEEMGLENHVYSPAYRPQDMEELAQICDHIIFNSEKQLRTYLPVLKASGTAKAGLRINPECSTQEGHAIYDPVRPAPAWASAPAILQTNWLILWTVFIFIPSVNRIRMIWKPRCAPWKKNSASGFLK